MLWQSVKWQNYLFVFPQNCAIVSKPYVFFVLFCCYYSKPYIKELKSILRK